MLEEIIEEKKEYKNEYERKIERLTRDKNLLLLENKRLIEKVANYEKESAYLNKRNATLNALEKSIPNRIETYKSKNAPDYLIKELEMWQDMLSMDKEKSLEHEEE